jgi:hypothetical protein
MHKIETIYLFLFVFSILVSLKGFIKFLSALLQKDPKPLVFSNRELLYLGASISYLITYIITQ